MPLNWQSSPPVPSHISGNHLSLQMVLLSPFLCPSSLCRSVHARVGACTPNGDVCSWQYLERSNQRENWPGLCPRPATSLSCHPGSSDPKCWRSMSPVIIQNCPQGEPRSRDVSTNACDFKDPAVLLASRYFQLGVLMFPFSKVKYKISFSMFQIIKTLENTSFVKDR